MHHLQIAQTVVSVAGLAVITAGLLLLKTHLQKWGRVCRIPE